MSKSPMTVMIETARNLIKLTDCDVSELRDALPSLCPDAMGTTGEDDVTLHLGGNDWRFIRTVIVEKTLADELKNDEYILGCFTDWFLAEWTDIDLEVIQALQSAEAYEALGKLLIKGGHVEAIAEGYVSTDGAGHHFSSYDGSEETLVVGATALANQATYSVFNLG